MLLNPRKSKLLELYLSLKTISGLLSNKDKTKILVSAILLFFSSILEVAAISTMYPFLLYAFGNESDFTAIPIMNLEAIFDLFNGSFVGMSAIYILFIICSATFRIVILRQTGRYIASCSNNLAHQVFERTIFGGNQKHSNQEVISSIIKRCDVAMGVLICIAGIFSALVLIMGVAFSLISINPIMTLIGISSLGACYLLMTKITSKKSLDNGAVIDKNYVQLLKIAKQCLGNFKNIVIEGRMKNELLRFRNVDSLIRLRRLNNHLINSIPRLVIETFIICIIITSVVYASLNGINVDNFLPLIGLYAIAFQKLLPSINSLFTNYSNILQSAESLNQLARQVRLLVVKEENEDRIYNVQTIELINISNKNQKTKANIYKPISLFINKGDKIVIRGSSGVGKSTFLESIIGLNASSTGIVRVNNETINKHNKRRWWNSLTYIPQTPYIFEGSLYYNITLSQDPKVFDSKKYEMAYRISRLPYDCDASKHHDIAIAEDGGNLSGGEKQRLVLARAIYRMKNVIFLDESLSAIDPELRHQILTDLIESFPEFTVLYISHNPGDLALFDKKISVEPS